MEYEVIFNQVFLNKTIYVNGKEFRKCTFQDCVFEYYFPPENIELVVAKMSDCVINNYKFDIVVSPKPYFVKDEVIVEIAYNDDEWV